MTDRPSRRRASKRALRVWAWTAGGLAFLAPFAALGASPKPAGADVAATGQRRPVVIVRKITRVVVIRDRPADVPVQYVSAPSSSSSSPSTGTTAAASSASSSNQAPAPAPAPTNTGGS